ncbi:MAG: hypothetical protein ABIT04_05935 [Novosphingobium sp.]
MSGAALAQAARALVGTRFLLHGRDPASGLDCIGVLAASLAAIGREPALPNGYALRTRQPGGLDDIARGCGLISATPPGRVGDVLLLRVGACQFHLMLAVDADRFVHAHAGLRRVALLDGEPGWPIVGRWRLPNDK